MSSTESTPHDDEVHDFFSTKLVPVANELRESNIQLMPLGPDDSVDSWYVDYPTDREELFSFDSSKIEAELRQLWSSQEQPQLLGLCEPIGALAEKLAGQTEDEDDVSPFIYVMF